MKARELREKTVEELVNLANESRSKLSQARFSAKASQLKNHHEITQTKKNLARILTLIKEKDKKTN